MLSLILCLIALFAPPVHTEVRTFQSVNPVPVIPYVYDEQWTFNVPQFDPALGTLVGVDLSVNLDDVTRYGIEFLAPPGTPGRGCLLFTNHSWTELSVNDQILAAGSGGEGVALIARNAWDGTTDLHGPSGASLLGHYAYVIEAQDIDPGAFAGNSTVPVSMQVHHTQFYWLGDTYLSTSPLHAVLVPLNGYVYSLTVTYRYI